MPFLDRILPAHFDDATQRSLKDAVYRVTDPAIFNQAVFTGGKATEGDKLKCIGKNEGGWPQFIRVGHESERPLSMTYRAKGKPDSFGLQWDS